MAVNKLPIHLKENEIALAPSYERNNRGDRLRGLNQTTLSVISISIISFTTSCLSSLFESNLGERGFEKNERAVEVPPPKVCYQKQFPQDVHQLMSSRKSQCMRLSKQP